MGADLEDTTVVATIAIGVILYLAGRIFRRAIALSVETGNRYARLGEPSLRDPIGQFTALLDSPIQRCAGDLDITIERCLAAAGADLEIDTKFGGGVGQHEFEMPIENVALTVCAATGQS